MDTLQQGAKNGEARTRLGPYNGAQQLYRKNRKQQQICDTKTTQNWMLVVLPYLPLSCLGGTWSLITKQDYT